MRKGIAAAALVAVLAIAGCAQTQTEENVISGSVDTVVSTLEEASVDDEFTVEVTGYIIGDEPANSLAGSDVDHSTLDLYQDTAKDEYGYIKAVFHETDDEINDLIAHSTSTSTTRRVTIVGTSSGKDYGKMYSIVRDCEIKFD